MVSEILSFADVGTDGNWFSVSVFYRYPSSLHCGMFSISVEQLFCRKSSVGTATVNELDSTLARNWNHFVASHGHALHNNVMHIMRYAWQMRHALCCSVRIRIRAHARNFGKLHGTKVGSFLIGNSALGISAANLYEQLVWQKML